MYFDTHFHLNKSEYKEDIKEIIAKFKEQKLLGGINVGTSVDDLEENTKIARLDESIYSSLGIHPMYADTLTDKVLDKMDKFYLENEDKVVGIGECGLDYHHSNNPSREIQIETFKKQCELAKKHDLTLIVHTRAAFDDTIKVLDKFKELRVLIHCFTYGPEEAKEFVKRGYYISFSGIITFKNNVEGIVQAAKDTPLDRIVCETDSPLLTPVPYRGKTNYPHYVSYVYEKIKLIKQTEIEEQILKNVETLFKIKVK